jgi:hypothetical protein
MSTKFSEFVTEAAQKFLIIDRETGKTVQSFSSSGAAFKSNVYDEKKHVVLPSSNQKLPQNGYTKKWEPIPFVKESLTEAKDLFNDVDVIKLDPDRVDAHDIVSAIMPTLVRVAYTQLVHDQTKYNRGKDDEDPEFEFTKDELEERLDTLIGHVRDKLDMSGHDKMDYITNMSGEFKQKLEK